MGAWLLQNVVKLWIVKRLYEFVLFVQVSRILSPPPLSLYLSIFFFFMRALAYISLFSFLRSSSFSHLFQHEYNVDNFLPSSRSRSHLSRSVRYVEDQARNIFLLMTITWYVCSYRCKIKYYKNAIVIFVDYSID